MVSQLDKNKAEIVKIMDGMSQFTKSTRADSTYYGIDANGDKIYVRFKGNNFIVSKKGSYGELKIKSILIRDLKMDKIKPYLEWRMTAKAKESTETNETKEE